MSPRNQILASLPEDEYARIAPHLEPVYLEIRRVLFEVEKPIEHVYFPETAVVSVLSFMSDGTAVETATIGWEGMVGLPLFLGVDRTPAQAFCQVQGEALRMTADAFRDVLQPGSHFTLMLNRYTQALFTFVAQASACNRRHSVEQRCARWLLLSHDRVGQHSFPMTQQFLSQMLGVRRATVTEAAGPLQNAGLIEYAYGQIIIKDRLGLEAASCECYAIIYREFDRLLAGRELPSPLDGVRFSVEGKTLAGPALPEGEQGAGEN